MRSKFEPATFRFTDLPEWEAGALTHSATLTGLIQPVTAARYASL